MNWSEGYLLRCCDGPTECHSLLLEHQPSRYMHERLEYCSSLSTSCLSKFEVWVTMAICESAIVSFVSKLLTLLFRLVISSWRAFMCFAISSWDIENFLLRETTGGESSCEAWCGVCCGVCCGVNFGDGRGDLVVFLGLLVAFFGPIVE